MYRLVQATKTGEVERILNQLRHDYDIEVISMSTSYKARCTHGNEGIVTTVLVKLEEKSNG